MESILIIAGLILVAVVAIKWPRVVMGLLGIALLVYGILAAMNQKEWSGFLAGGEAKGIAPYVGLSGWVSLVVALLLLFGAWRSEHSKPILIGAVGLTLAVIALLLFLEIRGTAPFIRAMWRAGAVQAMVSPQQMREYEGTSKENLKALYTAMMLEHDSEGAYPPADKWMDAIKDRITTGDMSMAEAEKKYVNPMIQPPKKDQFGYAMNAALAGKYKDDIKGPDETLLIFDSKEITWNAHGDPKELLPEPPRQGGNLGITVSGKVVRVETGGKLVPLK